MNYPEHESAQLEFKETWPKNNQIVKSIVGFCNQNGGKLIVGVKDTGHIVGIPQQEVEHAIEQLANTIYESTCPAIIAHIYAQNVDDKWLLIIQVSEGMDKPYYVKSEGIERGTYIRLGRSTVRATPDMINELQWMSHGRSYDSMAVYQARVEDLDMDAVKDFFRNRKSSQQIPPLFDEALFAYKIIVEEHSRIYPTVAGILLFGKEPQRFLSEAHVICVHFAGTSGREALATRDCEGSLIQQSRQAINFVLSQLNRSFTIKGPQREEEYEIPEIAVREAIINALIHRNYYVKAPTKIIMYDDRVEIFSPGGFPGPINKKNLKMGLSYIRNVTITKMMRELGVIEKIGTGLLTIFDAYERYGLKEPEIIDGENFAKVILPRPFGGRRVGAVEIDDLKLIQQFLEKSMEVTIGEVVSQLGIPRATAGRKLKQLIKMGRVKKTGLGSGTKYSRAT